MTKQYPNVLKKLTTPNNVGHPAVAPKQEIPAHLELKSYFCRPIRGVSSLFGALGEHHLWRPEGRHPL